MCRLNVNLSHVRERGKPLFATSDGNNKIVTHPFNRALVTGDAGFIGPYLAADSVAGGCHATVLFKRPSGHWRNAVPQQIGAMSFTAAFMMRSWYRPGGCDPIRGPQTAGWQGRTGWLY